VASLLSFTVGNDTALLRAEIEKLMLRWEELMTAAEALQE
jgi:DNA polymerase III delta subunit